MGYLKGKKGETSFQKSVHAKKVEKQKEIQAAQPQAVVNGPPTPIVIQVSLPMSLQFVHVSDFSFKAL